MTPLTDLRSLLSLRAVSVIAAGGAALALAGCGPTAAGSTATTAAGAAQANGGQAPSQDNRQRQRPGAAGLIAAIDGKTLQVQGRNEQTAVTYTPSTRITTQTGTTSAALEVGDCVVARAAQSAPSSANNGSATTVDAATVTILTSDGKGCTDATADFGGFGGRGGDRPGSGIGRPSGAPSRMPGVAPGGGRGGFAGFGTIGAVTEVGTGTFTVQAQAFGGRGQNGSTASPTASPPGTTRSVTVTFTAATTFTATRTGTARDIAAGGCVRASGTVDDTGALTATTLALSAPVDGSCTSGGFGG